MERITVLKIAVFVLILLIVGAVSYFYDVEQLWDRAAIQRVIEENYIAGVLFFIGTTMLLKLLFIPVVPVSLAAGFLFGGLAGTVITLVSVALSAALAFYLSRYLGFDFVQRILQDRMAVLKRYSAFVERHGFLSVLFFRIVPVLPNMVVNLGFGLLRVSGGMFILGTVLGTLPGAFLLANIGNTITDYTDPKLYVFGALYILLIAGTAVWGYQIRKRHRMQ